MTLAQSTPPGRLPNDPLVAARNFTQLDQVTQDRPAGISTKICYSGGISTVKHQDYKRENFGQTPRFSPTSFGQTPRYSSSTDQVVQPDKYIQAGGLLILGSRLHSGRRATPAAPELPPLLGPALVRKLRCEAMSRVGSWLNYATIHVRTRGAAVSSSPGTFGWAGYGRAGRRERPRADGPPVALSVHVRLRRIGFALLCRYPGLRADPEALADALKWAAARRRLGRWCCSLGAVAAVGSRRPTGHARRAAGVVSSLRGAMASRRRTNGPGVRGDPACDAAGLRCARSGPVRLVRTQKEARLKQ